VLADGELGQCPPQGGVARQFPKGLGQSRRRLSPERAGCCLQFRFRSEDTRAVFVEANW
jgi:hypothetical protein